MADEAQRAHSKESVSSRELVDMDEMSTTMVAASTQISLPPFGALPSAAYRVRSNRTWLQELEARAPSPCHSGWQHWGDPTDDLQVREASTRRHMRCAHCKRRLNITNAFECRCGSIFCALHRHAEAHVCTYDYQTEGRKMIEKANPRIVAPKIIKF